MQIPFKLRFNGIYQWLNPYSEPVKNILKKKNILWFITWKPGDVESIFWYGHKKIKLLSQT